MHCKILKQLEHVCKTVVEIICLRMAPLGYVGVVILLNWAWVNMCKICCINKASWSLNGWLVFLRVVCLGGCSQQVCLGKQYVVQPLTLAIRFVCIIILAYTYTVPANNILCGSPHKHDSVGTLPPTTPTPSTSWGRGICFCSTLGTDTQVLRMPLGLICTTLLSFPAPCACH